MIHLARLIATIVDYLPAIFAVAAGFLVAWALRADLRRRRTVEDLRQLSHALDYAGEGIARLDTHGNYRRVNAVYARYCGFEPREMIGRHWTLTVDPRDHPKMGGAIEQMLQNGMAEIEALGRRKDGTNFQKHVILAALKDRRGNILGHYRLIKDVTLRNLSETALSESQRRFRVLAAHAPVGIFQCDIDGKCSYVNARWTELTGIDPRQARDSGWLGTLHPDNREQIAQSWREAADAGRSWIVELRFCPPGQREIRTSCSADPLRDDQGAIRGYIGTITDITALKQNEETLARQTTELRRSNRELEQFAYIASHDLQEPLRMVANYTQLLRRRYQGQFSSEADEFIQYAVDGAQRMRSLIDDLLNFSRISHDIRHHEPVSLQQILKAVLADLSGIIQQTGAMITSGSLPTVMGNPNQLRQVLQNLIENAIKFCRRPPRIHIESARRGGLWTISVRDNGIGMDPDHLGKIFQIFQRLHGSGEFPGNGVGLAVCKRVIEHHGGAIEVVSKPDNGSTFTFSLPEAAFPHSPVDIPSPGTPGEGQGEGMQEMEMQIELIGGGHGTTTR